MSRILIIEDAVPSREAMAKLLRLNGYDTACAANGAEGMARMRQQKPDLVLLDQMMPEVDGLTFLAGVRRFPKWKDLPVIMFTAVHDLNSQTRAERLGVTDYLIKARVTPTEVVDRIRTRVAPGAATAEGEKPEKMRRPRASALA